MPTTNASRQTKTSMRGLMTKVAEILSRGSRPKLDQISVHGTHGSNSLNRVFYSPTLEAEFTHFKNMIQAADFLFFQ